jgi:hypothetical protein
MTDHPPRPRFALKIGIVGHRPDDLPKDSAEPLVKAIGEVLDAIVHESRDALQRHAQWFSPEPPLVSMMSALAEGSDRFGARAALSRGVQLFTCLPFNKADYEHDFKAQASLDEFRDLLAQSTSVLELSGSRSDPLTTNRGYEFAGLTTVIQADLIIAVWDGGLSRGRGGTREMIAATTRIGTPVIHIDPSLRAPTLVKWRGLSAFPAAIEDIADLPSEQLKPGLAKAIEALVRPPTDVEEQQSMTRFFAETGRLRFRRHYWNALLACTWARGLRWPQSRELVPDQLAREFADLVAPFPYAQKAAKMIQAFGFADAIGTHYSHQFRSAFVFNFFWAAVTVATAAIATVVGGFWHVLLAILEAGMILAVIVNTGIGLWRRWHQRWFEGRELAERLRVALPFWAVGIWPGTFTGPEPTWGGWYTRALMREQPPLEGTLDRKTLASYRAALIRLLCEQSDYHDATERSMQHLNVVLEWAGVVLLVCSLALVGVYALGNFCWLVAELARHHFIATVGIGSCEAHWVEVPFANHLANYVSVLGVILPALATASYGIRVIGDFDDTADRSRRSAEALKWLIDALEQDDEELSQMRARTYAAADVMLGEVQSWRLAAESRALAIPG